MKLNAEALQALPNARRALLINALPGFRSANLLATVDSEGMPNLAVVSSATHIGSSPALIAVVLRRDTADGGTLKNILESGVFTLNHIGQDFYQAAHQASAKYPVGVSEFEPVGLTPSWTANVAAPYVEEARVRYALAVDQTMPIEGNDVMMVVGRVTEVEFPESCLADDGYLDLEGAGTVALSSLDTYHATKRLAHLSYAKPDIPVAALERAEIHSVLARKSQNSPAHVLVVGATGGIGAAICDQLADRYPGLQVTRTARDLSRLPALETASEDMALDLCSDASIADCVQQLKSRPPIDWVVIASGWLHDDEFPRPEKQLSELRRAQMQRALDVNFVGPSLLLSALLKSQDRRRPLNIGVLSARVGSISDNQRGGWHSYRASKAALNMMIKNIALEFQNKAKAWCIVGLQPGTTASSLSAPFTKHMTAETLQTAEYTASQLCAVMAALVPEDSGRLLDYKGMFFEP